MLTGGGPVIETGVGVLLYDEDPLVRTGLRAIFAASGDITVVGEARDESEAITAAKRLMPTVVAMSIPAQNDGGFDLIQQLARANAGNTLAVVVLADLAEDDRIVELVRAGALGVLEKGAAPEELVRAVRTVAAGEAALCPSAARKLVDLVRHMRGPVIQHPKLEKLTMRERQILRLVAKGWSNPRIAKELSLGEATIKSHIYHLRCKLDLEDRAQAVVFAYEHGLVDP